MLGREVQNNYKIRAYKILLLFSKEWTSDYRKFLTKKFCFAYRSQFSLKIIYECAAQFSVRFSFVCVL